MRALLIHDRACRDNGGTSGNIKKKYNGHIINVKRSKVTVMYLDPNETEDDGEEEKLTVDQLLVDYIIGDIEFCDNLVYHVYRSALLLF